MEIAEAIDILENEIPHCGKKATYTESERYEAYEMAISSLCAQHEQELNDPLTLDELRQMDGEPVFLIDLVHRENPKVADLLGGWVVFTNHNQNGFIPRGSGFFSFDGYGKVWIAYRRKPKEC